MKIYFYAAENAGLPYKKRLLNIIENLKLTEQTVITNLNKISIENFRAEFHLADSAGDLLIKKIDGLIIDDNAPLSEISYLIALALSYRKPILYLIAKGQVIDQTIEKFINNTTAAKFFKIRYYTANNLESQIADFLKTIPENEAAKADIKFTLRLTIELDKYLAWRSRRNRTTKANLVRKILIEQIMRNDEKYHEYLINE